jgi:hypothetical protein
MGEDPLPNKRIDLPWSSQVVFKKLNVTLEKPVDFGRRSNPVVKAEVLSVLAARRADPSALAATISVWVALR